MTDEVSRLFEAVDRGRVSRRQLLKALGVAAVAAAPVSALAQGQCGGKLAGTPGCNQEPARLPFKPTGWKTVRLDHLSFRVANHEKEAAFYNALMNWGIRSDNGQETVLDIGNWGGLVLRGGYQLTSAEVAADRARYEKMVARFRAQGFNPGPFVPRNVLVDGFCWGIEPWDAKKVEEALKARGLNPMADNAGGFESFHVQDPGGFDLQISNGNRRTPPAHGKTTVPDPFAHTDWKTIWLDHISYQCADYKKVVAFYEALLGWKPGKDEGSLNMCEIGNVGGIIIRRGYQVDETGKAVSAIPKKSFIDHIAFGITPFNPDQVAEALKTRGLEAQADTGSKQDIHVSKYKSYHTTTPNGFNLQISNADLAHRNISLA